MEIQYREQFEDLLNDLGLVGDTVEVGVAEGRFSEKIISWPNSTKHYMIDSWQHLDQRGDGNQEQAWHDFNFSETLRRTKEYESKAVFLKGLSRDMIKSIPDDSLIFAYLDGDHSYAGCLSDLINIYPKLRSGSILAGHDYLAMEYGVNRAVKEFIGNMGYSQHDTHIVTEDHFSMSSFWLIKK